MRYHKSIFICLLIFFSFAGDSAAELIPVGVVEYQPLYDWYRRQEIINSDLRRFSQTSPLEFDNSILTNYPLLNKTLSIKQIRPFIHLGEDISAKKYARLSSYEYLRGGFTARPSERISIYADFVLDEKLAKDPNYAGKKWRGLAGEIANGFINYNNNILNMKFGRFVSNWGPENSSLVLSSTARSMDGFAYRFHWGPLSFAYQTGQLDKSKTDIPAGTYENRYFAGHRLDLALSGNLNIGLFETVIFGGVGRSLELAYLNPLMIYHTVQLNDSADDNTFIGLDFSYYLNKRHKFYGQLLIDDYQIEKENNSDNEPNEIGYCLGFKTVDVFGFCDLGGEYLRIANRTYNQKNIRNHYINRGVLIGDSLGPDSDRLTLSAIKLFNGFNRLEFRTEYQRKGEGRYDSPWTEPWLNSSDGYKEKFPTGVVERRLLLSLNFTGFVKEMLYFDCAGGINLCQNLDNIESQKQTIPFFRTRITIYFTSILDIH
jgi:hypothetical protein